MACQARTPSNGGVDLWSCFELLFLAFAGLLPRSSRVDLDRQFVLRAMATCCFVGCGLKSRVQNWRPQVKPYVARHVSVLTSRPLFMFAELVGSCQATAWCIGVCPHAIVLARRTRNSGRLPTCREFVRCQLVTTVVLAPGPARSNDVKFPETVRGDQPGPK